MRESRKKNPRVAKPTAKEELMNQAEALRLIGQALHPPQERAGHSPEGDHSFLCKELGTGLNSLPNVVLKGTRGGFVLGDNVTIKGINNLTESLVVIAERDIDVAANAEIRPYWRVTNTKPTDPDIKVVLVSLRGKVHIHNNAEISAQSKTAPPGQWDDKKGPLALADGKKGRDALLISLGGENVFIDGTVSGTDGGYGGTAMASGEADPKTNKGGGALAFSGPGGRGGDVWIWACLTIKVNQKGKVSAGWGGHGGEYGPPAVPPFVEAFAESDNGQPARALGGDGGKGGSVYFVGTGRDKCKVTIRAGAEVSGGGGGLGGDARAVVTGTNKPKGGSAYAVGGEGQKGGTVKFIHCQVQAAGKVTSGQGAQGGDAIAKGGWGANAKKQGTDGGKAGAVGGNAAFPGDIPTWQDGNGNVQKGGEGIGCKGGDAEAQGGDGGEGTGGTGGKSGASGAMGGANSWGQTATPQTQPSQPPNGEDGGSGQKAESPGKPR